MFTQVSFANTCKSDPEDTIARKISERMPELQEGAKLPSLYIAVTSTLNHSENITRTELLRANDFISIKVFFEDGSDVSIGFTQSELGKKAVNNLNGEINKIIRNKNYKKQSITQGQLESILFSKAVRDLSVEHQYFDAETELGSKIPYEYCSIEFEVKASTAKYQFGF